MADDVDKHQRPLRNAAKQARVIFKNVASVSEDDSSDNEEDGEEDSDWEDSLKGMRRYSDEDKPSRRTRFSLTGRNPNKAKGDTKSLVQNEGHVSMLKRTRSASPSARLMDAGNFEFYNHRATCTGRCVSRNNPKLEKEANMKEILDTYPLEVSEQGYGVINNMVGEVSGVVGNSSSNGQLVFPSHTTTVSCTLGTVTGPDNCDVTQTLYIKQEPQSDDEELNAITSGMLPQAVVDGKAVPTGSLEMTAANGTWKLTNAQSTKRGYEILQQASFTNLTGLPEDILTDSQTFWQGILGLGLIDDFFREIKASLDIVKNDLVRHRVRPEDCQKISRIVSELGLMTKLKWKLAAHKTETEKQKQKLIMEMEALKRRMAESVQKQKELKRKSDCFDHLIDMSKAKRQAVPKAETPSSSPSPASSPMPVCAPRIVAVSTSSTAVGTTVPVSLTRAAPLKETSETNLSYASPVVSDASSPLPVSGARIVTVSAPSTIAVTVPVSLTKAVPVKETLKASDSGLSQASTIASVTPVSCSRVVTVPTPSTTTVTVPVSLTKAIPVKEGTEISETGPSQASPLDSPKSEEQAD